MHTWEIMRVKDKTDPNLSCLEMPPPSSDSFSVGNLWQTEVKILSVKLIFVLELIKKRPLSTFLSDNEGDSHLIMISSMIFYSHRPQCEDVWGSGEFRNRNWKARVAIVDSYSSNINLFNWINSIKLGWFFFGCMTHIQINSCLSSHPSTSEQENGPLKG